MKQASSAKAANSFQSESVPKSRSDLAYSTPLAYISQAEECDLERQSRGITSCYSFIDNYPSTMEVFLSADSHIYIVARPYVTERCEPDSLSLLALLSI